MLSLEGRTATVHSLHGEAFVTTAIGEQAENWVDERARRSCLAWGRDGPRFQTPVGGHQ
jgi:hypothetical protein